MHLVVMRLHNCRVNQKRNALKEDRPIPKSRKLKCVLKRLGSCYDRLKMSLIFGQLLIILQESVFHLAVTIILFFRRYQAGEYSISTYHDWFSAVIIYIVIVLLLTLVYFSFRVTVVDGSVLRQK